MHSHVRASACMALACQTNIAEHMQNDIEVAKHIVALGHAHSGGNKT